MFPYIIICELQDSMHFQMILTNKVCALSNDIIQPFPQYTELNLGLPFSIKNYTPHSIASPY